MKKISYLVCLSLLMCMACNQDEQIQEQQIFDKETETLSRAARQKISLCHFAKSDNIWESLEINANSLQGHFNHGDAVDMDGDGYFNKVNGCSQVDCDDTNADINPSTEEICDNGIDDNCDGQIDENCAQTAQIGDFREGGVVFWVDPTDNTKGLVCAFSDSGLTQWGCYGTDLPNVPNVQTGPPSGLGAEIGHGMSNTNAILSDCPTASAALAARSNGPEWFLPSVKELNEMYENKATLEGLPGFSAFGSFYWSSTELNAANAWWLMRSHEKDYVGLVRAVRAF